MCRTAGVDSTISKSGYFISPASLERLLSELCPVLFGGSTEVSLAISAALLVLSIAITRPIKKLEDATGRIAEGHYGYRIECKGRDELSELAGHMNDMAAHTEADSAFIERVAESRRKFIANMTHELKTPLTSILGFADVLRVKPDISESETREYADIIFAEASRLKLLSSSLMELLTVEEVELPLVPVDIAALVEREVRVYRPVCEEAELSLCRSQSLSLSGPMKLCSPRL